MYLRNQRAQTSFYTFMWLIFLVLTFLQLGCSTVPFRQRADSLFLITDHVKVYYDLKNPAEKHFLPYVLSEVSGLTYLPEGRVLCVEDESGRAYEYSLKEHRILNAITFSDPGDFEGIEYVNGMIYVLESDGDIYRFPYTGDDQAKAEKFENKLDRKNDTEGLGYNPYSGRLLIACKEEEDIKGINAKGKTVYEFELSKGELIEKPFFEITAGKMKEFFETHRDFEYEKERIRFKPSAIAHNPLDGYFYLLASVGKMLIVLDKDGEVKASYPIAPRILSQPEGIFFAPDGDLYISSEGEGDKGYIVKFTPIEKE